MEFVEFSAAWDFGQGRSGSRPFKKPAALTLTSKDPPANRHYLWVYVRRLVKNGQKYTANYYCAHQVSSCFARMRHILSLFSLRGCVDIVVQILRAGMLQSRSTLLCKVGPTASSRVRKKVACWMLDAVACWLHARSYWVAPYSGAYSPLYQGL